MIAWYFDNWPRSAWEILPSGESSSDLVSTAGTSSSSSSASSISSASSASSSSNSSSTSKSAGCGSTVKKATSSPINQNTLHSGPEKKCHFNSWIRQNVICANAQWSALLGVEPPAKFSPLPSPGVLHIQPPGGRLSQISPRSRFLATSTPLVYCNKDA